MPNPLTLMTVVSQGRARPDASSGKEGESKSGSAFEHVMKEEVSQSETEADQDTIAVVLADEVAPSEDPPLEAEEKAQFTDSEPSAEPVSDAAESTLNPIPMVASESEVAAPKQGPETIVPTDQAHGVFAPASTPTAKDAPILPDEPAVQRPTARDLPHVAQKHPQPNPLEPNSGEKPPVRPENTVSVMEAITRHRNKSAAGDEHDALPRELPRSQLAQNAKPSTVIAAQQVGVIPLTGAKEVVVPDLDLEAHDLPSLRETTTTQTARDGAPGLPALAARADTARAIAGQMAAVISAKPGAGGVEIALNPEELGRVSITLNGRDDGMHLMIMAERPETLDLMRRHIALLSAEFEKLGYAGLSLDLGTSGDTPPEREQAEPEQGFSPTETASGIETANPIRTGPDRGLDMRL